MEHPGDYATLNSYQPRDATFPEFTSLCPKTKQPDRAGVARGEERVQVYAEKILRPLARARLNDTLEPGLFNRLPYGIIEAQS